MESLLRRVRGKPFYIWDRGHHEDVLKINPGLRTCCFSHILINPKKGGKEYPLFDYQNEILKALLIPTYINSRPMTEEDRKWYDEQLNRIDQGV